MRKRMCFYGPLLFLVVCSAMSGCETGEDLIEPTEEVIEVPETVEVVEVADRYDGESIYFKIGENFYEGDVVKGVSADEARRLG